MRIREITESLDSDVSGTIIKATNTQFVTKATINGRVITVRSASYDENEKNVWELYFTETKPDGSTTFAKTGSGGELKVFSFVIETIKELISRYQPDRIEFTSSKSDKNRTGLYSRIASKINLPGYDPIQLTIGTGSDDFFTINRSAQM